MILHEGRNGSRRIDHHVEFAEKCAPLLLELQTRGISCEPIAMAHDHAAPPFGLQPMIASRERSRDALSLDEGIRRQARASGGVQELHIEPCRVREAWQQRTVVSDLGAEPGKPLYQA